MLVIKFKNFLLFPLASLSRGKSNFLDRSILKVKGDPGLWRELTHISVMEFSYTASFTVAVSLLLEEALLMVVFMIFLFLRKLTWFFNWKEFFFLLLEVGSARYFNGSYSKIEFFALLFLFLKLFYLSFELFSVRPTGTRLWSCSSQRFDANLFFLRKV